jgi:hypothetical protein
MKLAHKVLEDIFSMTDDAIMAAFKERLEDFGFDNITIDDVSTDSKGDTVVTFGDDEGEMIEVLFTYDEEDGAVAVILDPERDLLDNEEDELDIIELDSVDPITMEIDGELAIDLINLDWLDENTLQAILTVGDLIDDQEDAEGDVSERSVVVVRGGKKVRLPIVRRKRKKRLSAKQKNAIRRGARKRKAKKATIQRKRKRSLKLRKRSGLKGVTNKNLKVQGTAKYKR